MKRIGYILLLLSIGIQFFAPKSEPVVQPDTSADCTLQQQDFGSLVGIHGEPLTIINNGSVQISVPTHFNYGAERITFGKNRTRTSFLRKMIHQYQPFYLVFRGRERLETSPFATSVGSTYYVYCLRRILC